MRLRPLQFFLAAALAAPPVFAASKQVCLYQRSNGAIVQVNSAEQIPSEYRATSRCFDAKAASSGSQQLAQPQDIQLKGTIRSETLASAVGPIKLRWPRKVEGLFGRTPSRAMAEAAMTVSRALKRPGFPSALQALSTEWNIVFMDEASPEQRIPAYLVSNCHPGWMTPVANIYVVGQRVAGGCGGGRAATGVADTQLAEVLIHEMGHAVEYQLLGNAFGSDRMRAEGFATWFEAFAADSSFLIPRGSARRRIFSYAQAVKGQNITAARFSGSASDYARASLYFHAIVARRGVPGLMRVYEGMKSQGCDFFSAVRQQLGWDMKRLAAEAERVLAVP